MGRKGRPKPKKLGKKLREVRRRLGMTQIEMAKKLGVDSGAISRYELGKREPSLLEILKYSYLSGVAVEILIDDKRDLAPQRW